MTSGIYFIGGWAYPKSYLTDFAYKIDEHCEVISFEEYMGCLSRIVEGQPSNVAENLAKRLKTNQTNCLLGWSLGGMLAIELACYYPELVNSLVLISSTARFIGEDAVPKSEFEQLKNALKMDARRALSGFFEAAASPNDISEINALTEIDLEKLFFGFDYLENVDLTSVIKKIKQPTLVIHGTSDLVIPPTCSKYLFEHMSSAKYLEIKNGSHALPIYECGKIVSDVRDFLGENGPQSS